jgi:hypothetical protein
VAPGWTPSIISQLAPSAIPNLHYHPFNLHGTEVYFVSPFPAVLQFLWYESEEYFVPWLTSSHIFYSTISWGYPFNLHESVEYFVSSSSLHICVAIPLTYMNMKNIKCALVHQLPALLQHLCGYPFNLHESEEYCVSSSTLRTCVAIPLTYMYRNNIACTLVYSISSQPFSSTCVGIPLTYMNLKNISCPLPLFVLVWLSL